MKDPFNQIQKYYSYNMGLRTTTLNKLADKLESTTKKKAVVAINSNTTATINCIVIRDGKLITNNPNIVHIFRAHSSIINRDGYLQVFSDRRTTRTGRKTPADRLEEVTEQRQKIIEAEPNFVISPTRQVIRNGNAKNVGGGHAGRRTMLCQINKNNWLVFVSSSSYGTVNAATSELMKYGCTAAVNLDGGSSSALYVKTSSMSSFNTYVNPGSSHPNIYTDILYFSE